MAFNFFHWWLLDWSGCLATQESLSFVHIHLKKVRNWGVSRGKNDRNLTQKESFNQKMVEVEKSRKLLLSVTYAAHYWRDSLCTFSTAIMCTFITCREIMLCRGGGDTLDWKMMSVKDKHSSVIPAEWNGSCRESHWAQYMQFLSCAEVVWRTGLSLYATPEWGKTMGTPKWLILF